MSSAPLRPLALLLAVALLAAATAAAAAAAAAAPAPRPPRQLPTRDQPNAHAKTSVSGRARAGQSRGGGGGGGGTDSGRFLSAVTGPRLQLLGPQNLALFNVLDQLGGLVGADALLSLFTASLGASSGGFDNPASVGTAESSEEVADLEV